MDKKIYKTYTKKFFNEEGRFIKTNEGEWLIAKDMFNWLGRVKANGGWNDEKQKMLKFLNNINQIEYYETFVVDFGKKKGKGNKSNGNIQTVDCLKIDIVPMVLTQFEPTARAGKEKHQQWCDLMKFINEILMELEVYKFITVDKEYQKDCMAKLKEINPNATQNDYKTMNTNIAYTMGDLIGVDFPVFKETLKVYNNQTTIDLLSVRKECQDAYLLFYETFRDYKVAYDNTLKLMRQRYPQTNN